MSEKIRLYGHQAKEEAAPSTSSFFHKAAKFSLFAPVLAILCNAALIASTPYLKQHISYDLQKVSGIMSLVTGALIILGFLLAIVAICGIPKHGAKGILARSLCSVFFNGTILGLAVAIALPTAMKVRARESNQSVSAQIDEVVDSIKNDVQKRFGKSAVVTATGDEHQDLQAKMDKAAKEYGGESAVLLKAASGFLHAIVELEKGYDAKALALIQPPVTSAEGLVTKEDVAARRNKVTEFVTASRKLKDFVKTSDAFLQEELKRNAVPVETMEKAMIGYRSQSPLREIAMKVWSADQRMAGAMLGVLDTLDNNWGKWKYDGSSKKVIFESQEALKYYNFYIANLQAVTGELKGLQIQLMAQLANKPDKH